MITAKKLKEKWITALRSGEFKRYKNYLAKENSDTYRCCLGVLCDVAVKEKIIKSYSPHEAFTPLKLGKFIGFAKEAEDYFAEMNDLKDFSFKKIADYIEKGVYGGNPLFKEKK